MGGEGHKRICSTSSAFAPVFLDCSNPPATKGTLQLGDGKPLAAGSGYGASADGFSLCLQCKIHHRLKPFLLLGRQRSFPYNAGLVQDCPCHRGLPLQLFGAIDLFRGLGLSISKVADWKELDQMQSTWMKRRSFSHPPLPCPTRSRPPQVSPVAPFLVATGVSATTFVAFSAFFAFRVGLLDMDSAEEERAQRLGKKRIAAWVAWWRFLKG